ncbi:hypothetical protein ABT160_25670 [Streptomyces sp. NPDC001941]|uniref:hypothetical protein n=1 Tax=Streptomyces sp. NPDC001941 TaxID=3154659 RepID=UPI00331EEB83
MRNPVRSLCAALTAAGSLVALATATVPASAAEGDMIKVNGVKVAADQLTATLSITYKCTGRVELDPGLYTVNEINMGPTLPWVPRCDGTTRTASLVAPGPFNVLGEFASNVLVAGAQMYYIVPGRDGLPTTAFLDDHKYYRQCPEDSGKVCEIPGPQ